MRKLLSRQIVTEQGIVEGSLTFQGDTITAIQPESLNEAEGSEAWAILPGIIDIHTHGGGGYLTNYLANSGSIDEIRKLSRFYASRGVTSFMATVSLWSEEKWARSCLASRIWSIMKKCRAHRFWASIWRRRVSA